MSSTEPTLEMAPTKTLVRRLVDEGVNQGRLDVVDQVLASSYPSMLPGSSGPASVKQLLATYREVNPDAHWTISEQIAEGEVVVTFLVASGRQRGLLWGIPATGKQMAVNGILVSHCQYGRIVAQRLQLDLLGLLQQLGVMPELGLWEEVIVAQVLHESRRCTG